MYINSYRNQLNKKYELVKEKNKNLCYKEK